MSSESESNNGNELEFINDDDIYYEYDKSSSSDESEPDGQNLTPANPDDDTQTEPANSDDDRSGDRRIFNEPQCLYSCVTK